MKKSVFLILILLTISSVYAICEEGQIDINSASKEELDNLYGIGLVKAEEIIISRPFESVNDLINVKGIGEVTLTKIKEQRLACVNGEAEEIEEEPEETNEVKENNEIPQNTEDINVPDNLIEETKNVQKTPIQLETIKLNTQNIKRENNNKNPDKSNYATYGFVAFSILLGFLFILKKRKNYKTEFEENER